MARIVNFGRGITGVQGKAPMPPDPSCQPCPDCGGLECLCRPRFFAGQLLAEQDLNRLDHYITEKHKLHNRHLWGSGVVCGLEVRCAPCDELVTVTPGYALSPCGEDIVVCKPDTVDICALIARCRTDTEPDCRPYAGQDSCGNVIEDWILAIRYAESPSRGIAALTGAGQGCGCSCGGSCAGKPAGSCGCGCPSCSTGAAHAAQPQPTLKTPRLNRGAPPSCEPTVTCEGYRYDVFRAPDPQPQDPKERPAGVAGLFATLPGDLMQRFACCLEQLQATLPTTTPGDLSQPIPADKRQDWFRWCCQVRTALANYLVKVGAYDCEAMERLQAVICPDPNQPVAAFQLAMVEAATAYGLIGFEAMVACFCSAALPPCPAPGDPRVPLALVKVRRRDCHIVSVCNWTPLRKHVLTFRNLAYWWGWIPFVQFIREGMHAICCDLLGLVQHVPQPKAPVADHPEAVEANPAGQPMNAALQMHPLSAKKFDTSLFQAVAIRVMAGGGPTVGDLVNTAFSKQRLTIDPTLTPDERQVELVRLADTAPLKLLGGMFAGAGPMLGGVLAAAGPALGGLGEGLGARVHADLAELKATVERQSAEIEALRARLDEH